MGQYPLLRCGDATIGPFSSGAVVRGSGSAQWWERAGAEAVRMGLLGRSGAGACPDLLQRRSGPGEAANESAEYQRFFSRAPARSGPLQQIWTNGAPADPCADGGRGDHPDPRAPRRALRTRAGTSNCTSREQNAHLDEHRTDPPPAPRTAPPRRRPVARGGPGGGRGQRRTSPGARSCGWGSCRRRRGRAGSVRRPLMRMGSRRRRARRGAPRPAACAVVA